MSTVSVEEALCEFLRSGNIYKQLSALDSGNGPWTSGTVWETLARRVYGRPDIKFRHILYTQWREKKENSLRVRTLTELRDRQPQKLPCVTSTKITPRRNFTLVRLDHNIHEDRQNILFNHTSGVVSETNVASNLLQSTLGNHEMHINKVEEPAPISMTVHISDNYFFAGITAPTLVDVDANHVEISSNDSSPMPFPGMSISPHTTSPILSVDVDSGVDEIDSPLTNESCSVFQFQSKDQVSQEVAMSGVVGVPQGFSLEVLLEEEFLSHLENVITSTGIAHSQWRLWSDDIQLYSPVQDKGDAQSMRKCFRVLHLCYHQFTV